ncbi:MAG: alpha-L-fucosidase [Planctomycetes bacterium GWF2_42_9]|nr:MAG: alpha-L-fucosidase [Planctomycetes bacterium GWF2_42_9]
MPLTNKQEVYTNEFTRSQKLMEDRFGIFIHWGLYSVAARHEWVQKLENISNDEYKKYFKHFDPDLYNPILWAKAASNAGMKFFCVTAKHHDGFCLWNTDTTDYKSTNTPWGKDVLTPMVEAFRSEGLRTGIYYSLIDWHHPDFVIDSVHPLSNHPERNRLNAKRDQMRYIKYMHQQVRELLTRYAPIDLLFFDYSYPKKLTASSHTEDVWVGKGRLDWDSDNLLRLVREIAPQAAVNDRLDIDDLQNGWDFRTPEQYEPRSWLEFKGQRVPWITCFTFSGSWGYHRDETTWKSVEQLIQSIINTVSKGGSVLLNVGPTGRGEFDERALDRLSGIGKWMKQHSRSIHGCTAAPNNLMPPQNCVYTYNPKINRLYVHIYSWPNIHLHLDGLSERIEYAQLLHDSSEIKIGLTDWYKAQISSQEKLAKSTVTLSLPIQRPNVSVPVIELFLK